MQKGFFKVSSVHTGDVLYFLDAKEEFRRLAKIGAVVFDVEDKGYKVVPQVLEELKKEYSFE